MLRQFERRLEALFEGIFAKQFKTAIQPVELAKRLAREMDEKRVVSVDRVFAPNAYVVYLSPEDEGRITPWAEALAVELETFLVSKAERDKLVLLTSPRVEFRAKKGLAVGQFEIGSSLKDAAPEHAGDRAGDRPGDRPAEARPRFRKTPAAGSRAAPSAPHPPSIPSVPSAPAPAAPKAPPIPPLSAGRAGPVELGKPPAQERAGVPTAYIVPEFESPPVRLGETTTIGRSAGNDLAIADSSVSRRHAEIVRTGHGYLLRDLGSTNGTYVDGQPVGEQELRDGDIISFGQSSVRFVRRAGGDVA